MRERSRRSQYDGGQWSTGLEGNHGSFFNHFSLCVSIYCQAWATRHSRNYIIYIIFMSSQSSYLCCQISPWPWHKCCLLCVIIHWMQAKVQSKVPLSPNESKNRLKPRTLPPTYHCQLWILETPPNVRLLLFWECKPTLYQQWMII